MRSLPPLLCFAIALSACGGGSGPTFAKDHPRIYMSANRDRLKALLDSGDPAAMRFQAMVDDELSGANLYNFESWNAALMGQLTGDPKYCAFAINQVDTVINGEYDKINSGQTPDVAHDDYLYIGPEVGDAMLTYDWCFDSVSNDQRTRWINFAAAAIKNVWHPDQAVWGSTPTPWNGWAIDDPSDNYYYSFLRATMMFGLAAHDEHPDAAGALDIFRQQKIGDELVPTFDSDLVGGGSREGTGYGVSMHGLWTLYDFWAGSTGEGIDTLTPHTRASLLYYLHAVAPTGDRLAPYGDHARDSTASFFDYDRNYIEELGFLFKDDALVPRAKYLLDHSSVTQMGQQFMYVFDFLYGQPAVTAQPLDGLGTAYFAPGNGELFARSSWDPTATWISMIAGPYTESHAHRDQGSILFFKGSWLAYDPVIDSKSGLRAEEEAHNLVRFADGSGTVQQKSGTTSTVTALHKGDGWLHVAADLTPAYGGDAKVGKSERELVYLEPDTVVVFDRVAPGSGVSAIWTLNAPVAPAIAGARATVTGDSHTLQIDRVTPASANATVVDWPSVDSDYTGGFRLDETEPDGTSVILHVLSADGAVTALAPDDTSGHHGVSITLSDGRTASVHFSDTGVDGDLAIHGPSGDITSALAPGVDALPE